MFGQLLALTFFISCMYVLVKCITTLCYNFPVEIYPEMDKHYSSFAYLLKMKGSV